MSHLELVEPTSDREPSEHDRELYEVAKSNGCLPVWYDGMFGWVYHCGCTDHLHCCDQQCSIITRDSATRRRPKEGVA